MNYGVRAGDVLNRVFELYKEHFGMLIPAAFMLSLVVPIPRGFVSPHDLGPSFIVLVDSAAVALLYQGIVVNLVRDAQDGCRDPSVGKLFSSVGPALAPLVGAALLYGIGI